MRIGILSDTHNQRERTRHAVELLLAEGVAALVHCGDFVDADLLALCCVRPCYFVFGNNDGDSVPELRRVARESNATCLDWGGEVTLNGKRIAVTHGHLGSQVRPLLAARPDYLLSGHSHVLLDDRDGPTRRINPGALHRAAEYTVAWLDLATDQLEFLDVPSIQTGLPRKAKHHDDR